MPWDDQTTDREEILLPRRGSSIHLVTPPTLHRPAFRLVPGPADLGIGARPDL
jgi:hypothetical protein